MLQLQWGEGRASQWSILLLEIMLVLEPDGAFKITPPSAGALQVTELLLGACWGIHSAVDYFLLRRKQASSSVMRDLMFVLHWCCLDTVMTDVFKIRIILETMEHY